MTYSNFIYKAKELAIQQLDNGMWYLEPEWIDIICSNIENDLDNLEDGYIDEWADVEDILKLEVEKRNLMNSKTKDVIDWLYDLITATVEPAMLKEETDYIQQVIEFMKTNHEQKDNIIPFPKK